MPDSYTSSSRNQGTLNRAYSQFALSENQAYMQIQPWQSDESMEILTSSDFETIYTNGYKLSGLEKVNPSSELEAQLNSINTVNQLNVREQIVKALTEWDDGPWYVTGDESNLIFHNHQEDQEDPTNGLVYYFNAEQGEVLKVVIASKDVYGAGAINRHNQIDYTGQQTKGSTIPTAEELKDVDWDQVQKRQKDLQTKTAADLKREAQDKANRQHELDRMTLAASNVKLLKTTDGLQVENLSLEHSIMMQQIADDMAAARQNNPLNLQYLAPQTTLKLPGVLDVAPLPRGDELREVATRFNAYEKEKADIKKADAAATAKLQKQAKMEYVAAREKEKAQSIQITPEQYVAAMKDAIARGFAANTFTEEDARAFGKYLEQLEAGKVDPITQSAINDLIKKYKVKVELHNTQTQQWNPVQGDKVTPSYKYTYEVHGTRAHPGGYGQSTSNYYANTSYNKQWNFSESQKWDIRNAQEASSAGQISGGILKTGTKGEIQALFNTPANYDRFISNIESSIAAERNEHQRNGEYLKGVQVFTEGNSNKLSYRLIWEVKTNDATVDWQDLILGDDGIVEIAKAVGSDVKSALGAGHRNANKALNHMRRARFREVEVQMQVVGRPSLVAPGMVKVFNIGQRYSGLWYIKTCIHQIESGSGYTTSLTLIKNKATAQTKVATVKVRAEKEEQVAITTVTLENRNPDGTTVKVDISVDTLETNMAILQELNKQGDHERAAAAQILINNGRVIHYTDEQGKVQIDYDLLNRQVQQIQEEREAIEEGIKKKTARIKQISKLSKQAKDAQASLAKVKVKDPKTLKYVAETAQEAGKQFNEYTQLAQELTSQIQQVQGQIEGLTSNFV